MKKWDERLGNRLFRSPSRSWQRLAQQYLYRAVWFNEECGMRNGRQGDDQWKIKNSTLKHRSEARIIQHSTLKIQHSQSVWRRKRGRRLFRSWLAFWRRLWPPWEQRRVWVMAHSKARILWQAECVRFGKKLPLIIQKLWKESGRGSSVRFFCLDYLDVAVLARYK